MSTLSANATTATQTSGTWTSPTNATGADNAGFASWASTTRSASAALSLSGFGTFSAIGASDTINSVTVRVKGYSSVAGTPISSITSQLYDGTTAIGSPVTHTLSTTSTNVYATFSVTGVSVAQVQSGNLTVRHTATRANSTTTATVFVDSVQITVDYTAAGPQVPAIVSYVNTRSIGNGSTAASSITDTPGVDLLAGDVLIAVGGSNGTHVTNGMSIAIPGNGNMATVTEMQHGNSSSKWGQLFILKLTAPVAATDVITFTPYAGSTTNGFTIGVFRSTTGDISRAAVYSANGAATTSATAALSPVPPYQDLVVSAMSVSTGTSTPPTPYTKGSENTVGQSQALAYVLAADGVSGYGGNWTITNNTSATVTMALTAGTSTPATPTRQGWWGIPLAAV